VAVLPAATCPVPGTPGLAAPFILRISRLHLYAREWPSPAAVQTA